MIVDIHVHLAGANLAASGNYLSLRLRGRLMSAVFRRRFGITEEAIADGSADEVLAANALRLITDSQVDKAVLLALDGAWHADGTPAPEHTHAVVSNDYVAAVAARSPKTRFGASIHPFRRDALAELERVVQRGACLMKWIPSAQNIPTDHPQCLPFYEALVHHRLPLLCHFGKEHTLPGQASSWNDPRRLLPALQRGVTVIGAHCGTRMFLHERSYFNAWCRMAAEHANLYGDLSLFGLPLHLLPLRKILRTPSLLSKVVFGSDFPAFPLPLWYSPTLGLRQAWRLQSITNPLDRTVETLRALGVPEVVFQRAEHLLRSPL